MNIRLLITCAVLLTFAQACKKNMDTPSTNDATVLLSQISHISGSGSEVTTFKYDSQNRLIEYSDNSSTPSDQKITYDASDRVTDYYNSYTTPASQFNQVAVTSVMHYTYKYIIANEIDISTLYSANGGAASTGVQVATLNDKGQTVKLDYGNYQYSVYTYNEAGNKLSQSDYFNQETKPRYVFSYTYDKQKGYFSGQKGNIYSLVLPQWFNNPLTQTEVDSSVSPAAITTYSSTFEYDANGYPTKETRVKTSSRSTTATTDVYTYAYITK